MKVEIIPEPELEFGGGAHHIDVRYGLTEYGPLDHAHPEAPKTINVGIVGSPQSIEGVCAWLNKCRSGIAAKVSRQPNLFPSFPGATADVGLRTTLVTTAALQKELSQAQISKLIQHTHGDNLVIEATDMFMSGFEHVVQNAKPDVLICAWPAELLQAMEPEDPRGQDDLEDEAEDTGLDFHDLLKARGMSLRCPMQVIRPSTYDETQRRKQVRRKDRVQSNQDEATRAWNLHTALYYKAGGTPWRIMQETSEWETCYVGVSFYKTRDGSRLMTSVAQVFNQRGEGVIMRGGKAKLYKDDKCPYLETEDARNLLFHALTLFKEIHGHPPARVVLHKTSPIQPEEEQGFVEAAESKEIERLDLIHVSKSYTRLLRAGVYPPRRGTVLMEDENAHVLYTKGSVEFYRTYPGQYLPVPLRLRYARRSRAAKSITQETLALTKMNWNNTQFDGSDPITIRAARQVSHILKYVADGEFVEPSYKFYM